MSDLLTVPAVQFGVNVLQQKEHTVYSFVMTADELAQYCRVDRFGESSDGVNRKLDENHALKIATAMIESDSLMLDAICGDLQGDWQIRGDRLIRASDDAFLSIDDGQHRWWAVTDLLNPEERARWEFNIVATKGIPYETRLRIFRQQAKRKRIDTKLDLAQRHALDDWKNEQEREAYNLLIDLNSNPTSPLRGLIILEETVTRTYENQHRPYGVAANGLWSTLKSVMSKGSPLHTLSVEKRVEVVRNMIWVASETWPKVWRSENHILTTARGLRAVLMLMVSSPEFRGVIGEDFRIESLRKALGMARKFVWHKDSHKNSSVEAITDGLNRAIGNARHRNSQVVA